MGLQKVFTAAGLFCLVIGAFASLGWLIRDVLGYKLGFQGSFFPFVMLTFVGAGFVIGGQREP